MDGHEFPALGIGLNVQPECKLHGCEVRHSQKKRRKKKAAGPSDFSSSRPMPAVAVALTVLRGIKRDGSEGKKRGWGVLYAPASVPGMKRPGTKARPNDFNGRRMSLQPGQLLAERARVGLTGATGAGKRKDAR